MFNTQYFKLTSLLLTEYLSLVWNKLLLLLLYTIHVLQYIVVMIIEGHDFKPSSRTTDIFKIFFKIVNVSPYTELENPDYWLKITMYGGYILQWL